MKFILFLMLSLCATVFAKNEKWVFLGDSYYYDLNSIKKKGDLSEINAKQITSDNLMGEILMLWVIDCKKRTLLVNGRSINISLDGGLSDIYMQACEPKWKFWK